MVSKYLKQRTTTASEDFSVPVKDLLLLTKKEELFKKVGENLFVKYEKFDKDSFFDAPSDPALSTPTSSREQVSITYTFRPHPRSGFVPTKFEFYTDDGDYTKIKAEAGHGTRRFELEKIIVDSVRECLPGYVTNILPKENS